MYLGKRYMTQFPSSNFTMCISSLVMYITDKKKKKKKPVSFCSIQCLQTTTRFLNNTY